jgi:hypothetical protein
MNERIEKLAVIWANRRAEDEKLGITYTFSEPALEMFTGLIIKECMRQVEEQYLPILEDEIMMKDTHWDGYVQCGVDSYVAIREHFYGEEE